MKKFRFDFVYMAPALLCNVAILCGIVPAVLCLDGMWFAYISVAVFLLSMIIHLYILFLWKRYRQSSPFAYAIVQPILHLITLVFALAVGATNLCVAPTNKLREPPLDMQLPAAPNISDALNSQ